MLLISYMIQHYFNVPYQSFTEKAISAYALLRVVENVKPEDIERVRWLQLNTNEKIRVALWKLDRSVNPTKGSFYDTNHTKKFKKKDLTEEEVEEGMEYIELDADQMQNYLCEAINEIHTIVSENIKGYKEEIKMEDSEAEEDDGGFGGFSIK